MSIIPATNRGMICRICGKISAQVVLVVLMAVLVCIFSQSQASAERQGSAGKLIAAETEKNDKFHSYRMDYSGTHKIPEDKKIRQSVKVYSPDRKWYAFCEITGDREGIREGSRDVAYWFGRVILVNASNGEKREILKTDRALSQYQAVRFAIEDWTKDSRYLLVSRQDEGGYDTILSFYDLSARSLHQISTLKSNYYCLGWDNDAFICHRGDLISYARSAKNGNFFSWTPPAETLVQMKVNEHEAEKLEKLRERNGLVIDGDMEALRNN